MSRSKRKTPKAGICGGHHVSEKKFKQNCNHSFRAKERRILRMLAGDPETDIEAHLPRHKRDVVEPWTGPKDGKHYFGREAYYRGEKVWTKKDIKKAMRK